MNIQILNNRKRFLSAFVASALFLSWATISAPSSNAENLVSQFLSTNTLGELMHIGSDVKTAYRITDSSSSSFIFAKRVSQSSAGTIAFEGTTPLGPRIFVANSDGTKIRQITKSDAPVENIPENDTQPQISPDGTQIAFLSSRAGLSMSPQQSGVYQLYVVNSDGSNLHIVTPIETRPNGDGLSLRSVTWSPDSKRIAFRGDRSITTASGEKKIVDALGFISPSGKEEKLFPIYDCAGGRGLDWKSTTVILTFGGSIQGCPNDGKTDFLLFSTQSNQTKTVSADVLGSTISIGAGGLRLSSDATRFSYLCTMLIDGIQIPHLCFNNSDGSQPVRIEQRVVMNGEWIWWDSDKYMPIPTKIDTKENVIVKKKTTKVQLLSDLLDQKGKRITSLDINWSGPIVSSTGVINPSQFKVGKYSLTATWGKISKKVTVTIQA